MRNRKHPRSQCDACGRTDRKPKHLSVWPDGTVSTHHKEHVPLKERMALLGSTSFVVMPNNRWVMVPSSVIAESWPE